MNQFVSQAEVEILRTILDLESAPGFADDIAQQQARRHLIETERDRRIPFFRGVAAVLHAELIDQDQPARTAQLELAATTLSMLAEKLDGPLATQARLFGALAAARLGRFDEAETVFADVARNEASRPSDIFVARIGGVINRTMRGGPAAGLEALASIEDRYTGADGFFHRILLADHRFILQRRLARQASDPAERAVLLKSAFESYLALLKLDLGMPTETVRAVIFDRLTLAADDDVPVDELPALVAIARGSRMTEDETNRAAGIEMLTSALERSDLAPSERAASLYALGKALFAAGQPQPAARRFLELATAHATDIQAEKAIELAAGIAADAHDQSPDDEAARSLLREALDVLLARYPNLPTVDRWRYAAGELALREKRFEEAMKLFGQIAPDAQQWLDANFMQASVARANAAAAISPMEAANRHEVTITVVERVQGVIEAGLRASHVASRADALRYYVAALRVIRAEALLRLARHDQAIQTLKDIEADASLDNEVIAEALRVRIAVYQAMNKPEEARAQVERFIQTAPEQAGQVLEPMLTALQRDVELLLDSGDDAAALDLARRTLVPITEIVDAWLRSPASNAPDDHPLWSNAANAFRLGGEPAKALTLYDRLISIKPNAIELLYGRAEALFALGGEDRLGQAITIYKRLASAGRGIGERYYWQSHLRTLQILDVTGRNTDQIRPRIDRLRREDATLGGERFRRGFEALQAKYAR
jgi:tetratricopeptide (TPR) repeat protein